MLANHFFLDDIKFLSDEEITQQYRDLFLKVLVKTAPDVWEDLKTKRRRRFLAAFKDVDYKVASDLYKECIEAPEKADDLTFLETRLNSDTQAEEFRLFHRELYKWANSNSLNKKWLLKSLFDSFWKSAKDENAPLDVPSCRVEFVNDDNLTIEIEPFQPRNWHPFMESWKAYEKEMVQALQSHIRNYVVAQKEAYEKAGHKVPRRTPDPERLEWLVSWTVLELPKAEIAARYRTALRTVESALQDFKKYDLPVRVGKSGRPKKS